MQSSWIGFKTWWFSLSPIPFILFTNALMICVGILITPILILLGFDPETGMGGPDFGNMSPWMIYLTAVIIAPIIETFIFQYIVVKALLGRLAVQWIILISSILFALAHAGYSLWYSAVVFPLGIILVFVYLNYNIRPPGPFWMTVYIHAFRNMMALMLYTIMH